MGDEPDSHQKRGGYSGTRVRSGRCDLRSLLQYISSSLSPLKAGVMIAIVRPRVENSCREFLLSKNSCRDLMGRPHAETSCRDLSAVQVRGSYLSFPDALIDHEGRCTVEGKLSKNPHEKSDTQGPHVELRGRGRGVDAAHASPF